MATHRLSNPLALAVLALLYERPMHPYEISATLRQRGKEESIKLNYGSLYSVVESLHKRGLIEAQETSREGNRPERTVYAITESGTLHMVNWLSDLLSRPEKEYPKFEAALSLMPALAPKDVANLLEHRLMRLEARERTYQAMKEKMEAARFPRLFWIESEFAHVLLKAEIEFVRELAREIKEERLDGQAFWQRIVDLRAAGHSYDEIQAKLREELKGELPWVAFLDD